MRFSSNAFIFNKELEVELHKVIEMMENYSNSIFEQLYEVMVKIDEIIFQEDDFTLINKQIINETEEKARIEIIEEWITNVNKVLEAYSCKNEIDDEFHEVMYYIVTNTTDTVYNHVVNEFNKYVEREPDNAGRLMKSYNRTLYWGALDYWNENLELIENRVNALKQKYKEFIWIYFILEDYTSKKVVLKVLENWLSFSHGKLGEIASGVWKQYFDLNLVPEIKGVFIDAGAYKGDTVDDYMKVYNGKAKIHSFEITPETFVTLTENMKKYDNVICVQKGLADKKGSMHVNYCSDIGGNRLGNDGEVEVEVTTIDEEIKEKIDFIKMDIEGAEYDALLGAKKHIREDHPVLAISAYHNNEDIWRLALLINEIDSSYKFYMRYFGGMLYPNDYVLYAI